MKNEIQIFNNPAFGDVRTTGTADNPMFCASDICRALGYSNGRDAIAKHCDEGDVAKCDTPYFQRSAMYDIRQRIGTLLPDIRQ